MIQNQAKRMQVIAYMVSGLYDEFDEPADALDQCIKDMRKVAEVTGTPFNWLRQS